MKTRSLLFAGIVAGLLSSPAWATTTTNLFENFSNFNAGWGATGDASKLLNGVTDETAFSGTDISGWTGTGLIFKAPSCIRLGNSGTKGVAISPVIRLSDKAITAGSATLSFHAARTAATVGVNTAANVTVLNPDGTTVDGISVYAPKHLVICSSMDNIDSCHTNTDNNIIQRGYTGLPNEFRLRFESSASSDGRVAIDAVLVVQEIRDTLSAPSDLALNGDPGANDFAVTWSAVPNAEGYSVKLLDANDTVVSSNDVAAATTTASFSDLVSSSLYTVVVVALGNHTTTDDSAPATLDVETAASTAASPTLVVANTSWTAGVAGTSAVTATLEGGVACTIASVSMSDGSSASVANGVFSWTPPAANAASTVVATFHVLHGGEGWYIDQALSVAATPAPSAPVILSSNVSHRSFDVSWSASAGGPVVEYKVRAWTGRATPDDATGGASENFASYAENGTVPAGWIFKNSRAHYNYEEAPVDFKGGSSSVTYWIGSPDFGGTISSFSFHLRKVSGVTGTFKVYGTTGSTNQVDWVEIKTLADGEVATGSYSVDALENGDPLASAGFSRLFFRTVKTAGNFAFGTFSVSGTDWPAANFLEDWGGAKVSVGTETSQTFSNPVPGTVNYVEVTAIGPSGLTATTIASVPVPRPSTVISVW